MPRGNARKPLTAPTPSKSFSPGSNTSPANPDLYSTPLALEENPQGQSAVVQPDPIGPVRSEIDCS
jgi:hypothetical protein